MKKWVAGLVGVLAFGVSVTYSGSILIQRYLNSLPLIEHKSRFVETERSIDGIPSINLWDYMGALSDEFDKFFDWAEKTEQKHIIINIHSPGGPTYDIIYMVNRMELLKSKGMIIETRSYSGALSGGFILFVNGSEGYRKVHPDALFMIHGPRNSYGGPANIEDEDVKPQVDIMAGILARSMNMTVEEVMKLISDGKNHYYTGTEMIELGWADGEIK
jgi:ATP-dependent protease ClpP protease subunit